MGMMWYPGPRGREWAEIDVSDPGYGYLRFGRLDDRFAHLNGLSDDRGLYAGPQLAALLDAVTQLALGAATERQVTVRASHGRPVTIAADEAAELLPQLQRAVALAMAGQDRFERIWVEDDVQDEPLCVNCNQGSPYSYAVTISAWCSEYGHTPFAANPGTSWAKATQDHDRQNRR